MRASVLSGKTPGSPGFGQPRTVAELKESGSCYRRMAKLSALDKREALQCACDLDRRIAVLEAAQEQAAASTLAQAEKAASMAAEALLAEVEAEKSHGEGVPDGKGKKKGKKGKR